MAKKLITLSITDIILQADAETIQQALTARTQIDELLIQREAAYQQIETIELQVEALVGEEGQFVYPAPPVPIAGFNKPAPAARPSAPKPKVEPQPEITKESPKEPTKEDAVEGSEKDKA